MIRYLIRNIKFFIKDLTKNIARALISSFGILFLMAFLVLYLSMRQSVKQFISEKLFGSLSINEITISPRTGSGRDVISTAASAENTIRPWAVQKIRAMKELTSVYTLTKLNYESKLNVDMLGKIKTPHAPVFGMDTGFFSGKIPRWEQFRNRKVLPVIAPKISLKLLNNYAAVRGLPQFTENMLTGYPGEIQIRTTGYGTAKSDEKKYIIQAELHSFTGDVDFYGILLPNEFIYDFVKIHGGDNKGVEGFSYIKIFAKIKDAKILPEITKKISEMNLSVESQSDVSRKMNQALDVIDGLFLLIGMVILILTILAIFNSYLIIVQNRSYGFSLKRVIGVSKFRIVFNFIIEAGLIGALYGVIGFYAGVYLTKYLSINISTWIPVLQGLIIEPAGNDMLFKAVMISIIISSSAAFIPAVFASNMNLFKAVKKVG